MSYSSGKPIVTLLVAWLINHFYELPPLSQFAIAEWLKVG
jgi:hypothetical protein